MPAPDLVLPVLSSSAIAALLTLIITTFLKSGIEKSVAHNFDNKLEHLRSELRNRESEIATLRSTALGTHSTRTAFLEKRRIDAAERIWAATIDLTPFKNALMMTKSFKMDSLIEAASKKDSSAKSIQQFGEVLWKTSNLEGAKFSSDPDKERPFVSDLVWANFSAYRLMLGSSTARLAAIKFGLGSDIVADPDNLLNLLKAALPAYSAMIDQHGLLMLAYLVEPMEAELLRSITESLKGEVSDEGNVRRAAKILEIAAVVAKEQAELPEAPPGFASQAVTPL